MRTKEIIARRGILEVVHYTTTQGLPGILDEQLVKARARLQKDRRLDFILRLNTPVVRDPEYEDYVNLSITRINGRLFDISTNRWHPDVTWCILAFDPDILTHDGVIFTTTNNIYPAVHRSSGEAGLEALFSESVIGRYGTVHRRNDDMPDNWTTSVEAEVLYPGQLSTNHLVRIYVRQGEEQDDIMGQIGAVGHSPVDVIVDPDRFNFVSDNAI